MSAILLLAWLTAVDGGSAAAPVPEKTAKLSAEDAEMLKHLDVLEAFDEAKDLELLEELSVER